MEIYVYHKLYPENATSTMGTVLCDVGNDCHWQVDGFLHTFLETKLVYKRFDTPAQLLASLVL